jgi:DNA-binding response OmpR family regulator
MSEQALERALNTDLLLLDVNLPDIHGFEVCRRLRGRPSHCAASGDPFIRDFRQGIDKAQGLDAGGDGYLTHSRASCAGRHG